MLLCFSCKQGWVPVPGIKLWKLIDLINNSHKRHDAHMRIPIHMHEKNYIYSQKPIHVHKIRIYIHKIRFTNAKHNSQMYNCVLNFECLKFTSVSWTVNVQIVFRVWIALDLCVYFWDFHGSALLQHGSLVLFSRGGLAIGRTGRIPGGLAANLARCPT